MSEELNFKKKALLISVSDYEKADMPQLEFCRKDGEKMYNLLKSLGYEISESNKLIGTVKSEIMRDTIADFFTNDINSKDILLFYFSGHGIVYDKIFYLTTSEIDPLKPYKRGIDDRYLNLLIDNSPSRKVIVILDSCHSGKANMFSMGTDRLTGGSIAKETIDKMNMSEGKFLLASCKDFQKSFGTQDGSKFTKYVIEGLKGNKNSVNNEGYVTPDSLARFVHDEMVNHPETDGTIQKPIKKVKGSGDVILTPCYEEFRKRDKIEEEVRNRDEQIQMLLSELEKLKKEQSSKPNDSIIEQILGQAQSFFDRKDYAKALESFDKILKDNPRNSQAIVGKGKTLLKMGLPQQAIGFYDKVLELFPENPQIWMSKGGAFEELGIFEGAIWRYDKAISLNPNDVESWYKKGQAFKKIGVYDRAEECFRKVLEIDPEDDRAKDALEAMHR